MPPAFATFDEPWAWMIRGLVEYGWPDGSRSAGQVPAGRFGALDLSGFAGSGGRDGIVLHVPAVADGRACHEDGVYRFVVKLAENAGRTVFVARCGDANYLQDFAWDPANPAYVAGYLHQALQEYVPEYVRWRLGGGELSWAQREGLPEFDGKPASTQLAAWVGQRLAMHRRFDTGPQDGWWADGRPDGGLGGGAVGRAGPGEGGSAPVASVGQAWAGAPLVSTGMGGGAGFVASPQIAAREHAKGAARALTVMTGLDMGLGGLALINALLTVVLYGTDYLGAVGGNICFGIAVLLGGGVSMLGARKYGEVAKGPLPWVSMAYTALVPICCVFGLPVAGYALFRWMSEPVRMGRQ